MKKNIAAIRGTKNNNRSANKQISSAKAATMGTEASPAEHLISSRWIWHPYAYAMISADIFKIRGKKKNNNIAGSI
jgi:hypothetical protein